MHLKNMNRIRKLPEFKDTLFTSNGLSKPVMMMTVDGGPKLKIDGHATLSVYIHPQTDEAQFIEKDLEWYGKHVCEHEYLLQIVKCDNRSCCKPRRSSLFHNFTEGFLPLPISQGKHGLEYGENKCHSIFLAVFASLAMNKVLLQHATTKFPKGIPYDFTCSTVQDMLPRRVCSTCGLYFVTIKSN